MKKNVVMTVAMVLAAFAVTGVQAQSHQLAAVWTSDLTLEVDTIALKFPDSREFIALSGFGGPPQTQDTADLGEWPAPEAVSIYWLVDGRRQAVFDIRNPEQDTWYDFRLFAPGAPERAGILFFRGVGGVEENPRHPASARLSAYPNPLAHRTRLSARLTRPARVTIDLFDESGALVRSLAGGEFAAGDYHWSWDGRDARGHRLAGGVYLARLSAGTERSLVKLVLTD